jgi:diguanylate cyclase (GGDEF)-like protein/PAS domain S-box-containing protein
MPSAVSALPPERNRDLHAIVQACPDAIIVLQDGRHVFANDRALQIYRSATLAELAARPALEYMPPALRAEAARRLHELTHERRHLEYVEEAIVRRDGTRCDIEVAGSPITYDGAPAALLVLRDITARKEVERAREAAEERFRSVFVNAPVGMAVLDTEGRVTEVNPTLAALVRRPVDELIGTSVFQWVHRDDRMASRGRFTRLLAGASLVETSEVRAVLPDGEVIWAHASTSTLRDANGTPTSFVLQLQDVSARRLAEDQLKRQAATDELTGLANRTTFTAELQRAIEDAAVDAAGPAVLFLDLDRFKVVNDSLGHGTGDRLLTQVAARLRACLRPGDLVARLGGDEFAVLATDVTAAQRVAGMARRLQESLTDPIVIDGVDVYANASIGIAFAEPGSDAEAVLRDADAAMYRAKACGGGTYVLFDENLRADCSQRMELENGLYGALGRGELFLAYQPIVATATGIMSGVEALLRWRRSDGTVVAPDRFVPIAEETGLIVPIGVWVVREACQQLRIWRATHPDSPPLSMAVNVSSRQLLSPDLVDTVLAELESIGPDRLTLEITATASAEIDEAAVRALERLDERGVRIAIDDFGTGQSSLARLRQLPVRLIKIDRQFTANVTTSDSDRSIVRATLAMAQALGLDTVAEGVETAEQAALLLDAGCVLAQGYLYDRPRPAEDLAARLARRHLGVAPGRRRRATAGDGAPPGRPGA